MRPIGCKDKSFIYTNPSCLMYDLRFSQTLDPDKVKKALSDTVRQNKQMSVRPVFVNGKVYYEENNAPLPILDINSVDGIHIGTDDTNGYLFLVCAEGKRLVFIQTHSLGDYAAGRAIVRQLCGYLAMAYGIDAGKELTLCAEISDEMDAYYPYEKYHDDAAKPSTEFRLAQNTLALTGDVNSRLRGAALKFDEREFVQYFKANDASFAPMLVDVISSALVDKYGNGHSDILTVMTANVRKYFNSGCLTNFSENIYLSLDADDKYLSASERCRKLKNMANAQLTKEHLQAVMNSRIRDMHKIENENATPRHSGKMLTYGLAYVGREVPEEALEGFLESIDTLPLVPAAPNLYIKAAAKTGCVHVDFWINSLAEEVALAVAAEFSKRGIHAELDRMIDTEFMVFNNFRRYKGYEKEL